MGEKMCFQVYYLFLVNVFIIILLAQDMSTSELLYLQKSVKYRVQCFNVITNFAFGCFAVTKN